MKENIIATIRQSIAVKQAICGADDTLAAIEAAARKCITALQQGGKILLAGNGGSAADAQHIAAELVGRFEKERAGLAAIALNTNGSNLTAIANDYDYAAVFARQVEALGRKDDIFIGLSTSGGSANVVAAMSKAKSMDMVTIGMTGESGGEVKRLADCCICVPSRNTARIQESHITIGHILCAIIEDNMQHAS